VGTGSAKAAHWLAGWSYQSTKVHRTRAGEGGGRGRASRSLTRLGDPGLTAPARGGSLAGGIDGSRKVVGRCWELRPPANELFSQAGAALLVEGWPMCGARCNRAPEKQGVFVEIRRTRGLSDDAVSPTVEWNRQRERLGGTGLCCGNLRSLPSSKQGNAALTSSS